MLWWLVALALANPLAGVPEKRGKMPRDQRQASPAIIETLNAEFVALYTAGRYGEAEVTARSQASLAIRALGPKHPWVGTSLNQLGVALEAQGKYDDARVVHERVLALRDGKYATAELAMTLHNLGSVLLELGQYDAAQAHLERAVEIARVVEGENAPNTVVYAHRLADVLYSKGDFETARVLYEWCALVNERIGLGRTAENASVLNSLGMLLATQGDATGARVKLEAALALYREVLGADHPQVAAILTNLGGVLEAQGDLPGALACHEEALAIRERALGPDHPDVAIALSFRAALLQHLGRRHEALADGRRALAVTEAALGPDHPQTGAILNNTALLLVGQGNPRAALPMLERSLAITEASVGAHPDTYVATASLGHVHLALGDPATARPLYEKAFAGLVETLGVQHPHTSTALQGLSVCLFQLGQAAEARDLAARALAALEQAYGPEDARIVDALEAMAVALREMGDADGARANLERALAIREATWGPDHPEVASTTQNLALVLFEAGEPGEARRLYERALAVQEATLGPDHPDVAFTLVNLGQLLWTQGDAATALPLYERALAIRTATYGEDSPMLATAWDRVGDAKANLGDVAGARAAYETALGLHERAWGSDHPEMLASLQGLAVLAHATDDHEAARANWDRALAVVTAADGPEAPELVVPLASYGKHETDAGNLAHARELLERAVAVGEATLGPDHPQTSDARILLARLELQDGRREAAKAHAERAMVGHARDLEALLDVTSERERLELVRTRRLHVDVYLDVEDDAKAAWSAALGWKGVAGRAVAASRPVDGPQAEDWQATKRAIAQLTFATDAPDRAERLAELTARKEALEREMATRPAPPPGAGAICAALPDDVALVDVLRWTSFEGLRYVAFVVGSDCEVARVDLGPAEAIEAEVERWRALLGTPDALTSRVDAAGARVRKRLWDPIAPHVGERGLVVVPDGAVAFVPFAALPVGRGRYLVEERPIAWLETAQDAVRPVTASDGGVLVVGGVDFGPAGEAAPQAVAMRAGACVDAFSALPGTVDEAVAVAALVGDGATVLSGAHATEEALRGALSGQRILHLATHGFFAGGACKSALAGPADEPALGWNPMALSGVALAGANGRTSGDGDDGLWTAEEVASLRLDGTELVVLSACETGLGELVSGEGVLGLRRAFGLAGVQGVVMSLWSVDDEATRELMTSFYERKLQDGAPTGTALRDAQLALLAAQRERWGEARPQTWAAFVVSGR